MTNMPNKSYSGPFHPLSPDEVIISDNLKTHVSMLAEKIGERNIWNYEELEASVNYIKINYSIWAMRLKYKNIKLRAE